MRIVTDGLANLSAESSFMSEWFTLDTVDLNQIDFDDVYYDNLRKGKGPISKSQRESKRNKGVVVGRDWNLQEPSREAFSRTVTSPINPSSLFGTHAGPREDNNNNTTREGEKKKKERRNNHLNGEPKQCDWNKVKTHPSCWEIHEKSGWNGT